MRTMARWVAVLTLLTGSGGVGASETIELAVIEPLSGPFANIGTAAVSTTAGTRRLLSCT